MAKVSTISALPNASMPKALRMPNTITSPTPTIQEALWVSIRVLRCSKFTSAMMPERMVSAVPAKMCTIR
ncbi:hypothetical protein D3C75_1219820 [compost metagenome]